MRKIQAVIILFIAVSLVQAAAHEKKDIGLSDKRFEAFEWNLNLPDHPVSRRVNRRIEFEGAKSIVLADIKGAGCIRRIWITGGNLGRNVVLRIYFDDEPIPYVEAPMNDFFGVMHNLMANPQKYVRGPEAKNLHIPEETMCTMDTLLLAVKPNNGFTSYFPMPFAKNARFEIVGTDNVKSRLYYIIDWHEYPGQKMKETMRFAARWRREAPVRDYADEFIMLDADGPGQLIGFTIGVDMLQSRHQMRWSHAGADNIYIDGDGDHPAYVRGIGGEDTFGTSAGGAEYVPQSSLFSDMPYYIWKDPVGDKQKLVGYRFFVNDAISFEKSVHMRFAARAHDLSSTVYWYTSKPVRPYFKMPPTAKRMPGSELRRGDYDLSLPETGQWLIAGPFKGQNTFEHDLPTEAGLNTSELFLGRNWQEYAAIHGFVDFNHIYRPEAGNSNSPALDGVALARAVLTAPEDTQATFTLAWDNQLVLRVNDNKPIDLGTQSYLQGKTIEVPLHKGENIVALWLSNIEGLTRGAWSFSFRAVTSEGQVLLPQALSKITP
jgi:hypothetical protein